MTTEGTTPRRITPPSDRENALYAEWKNTLPEDRGVVEKQFIAALRQHVSRVCWMVLRNTSPDLVDGIVFSILFDIGTFKEQSKFSTWAHRYALNVCHARRKLNKVHKDVPLEKANGVVVASKADQKILLDQLVQQLTKEEQEIIHLYLQGNSMTEISEILNETKWATFKRMDRAIGSLRIAIL